MKHKLLTGLVVALAFTILFTTVSAQTESKAIIPYKRFGLDWKTKLQEPVHLLRIWYTLDNGHSWKVYSETTNPTSPAPVKVMEDGVYGFYTQAQDIAGNEETGPQSGTPPKVIVVVDTKAPALVLVSCNNADVFSTAQDIRIEWNASDVNLGPTPISLYYSDNGGTTWQVIQQDLPNTGSYMWKVPAKSSEQYRVKIVATDLAGNRSEDISDNNFVIDGAAPVSEVLGPKESKSPNFEVSYRVEDVGGAGVGRIVLYYIMEGSNTWHIYGEDKDLTSPIHFEAKQGGRYGFKLVAVDNVNNSEKVPTADTVPDIWCLMDSIKPSVNLLSLKGANLKALKGGSEFEVLYTARDDNLASNPIMVQVSYDGGATWNNVGANQPNTGKFLWYVPKEDNINNVRLKVRAIDTLGNEGSDVSDPFGIDSQAPVTIVTVVGFQGETEGPEVPAAGAVQQTAPVTPKRTVDDLLAQGAEALRREDFQTAEAKAQRAISEAPGNAAASAFMGRVLMNSGRPEAAIEHYKKAIRLDPNRQDSHVELGYCYSSMARSLEKNNDKERASTLYQKAMQEFEAAAAIAPDTWEEYFNLGYVYAKLGNYDEAVRTLTKATSLRKDNGDAYWYLGQVYERTGEIDKAINAFALAADAYPTGSQYEERARYKENQLKLRK